VPILNYTTKVESGKTVMEIQHILGRKGASRVMVDYAEGRATAVTFALQVNGHEVTFRLPCNVNGVREALRREKKMAAARDGAQCERIAWRIVKDWIEAQMALVEAGQAEVAEVFLPYAIYGNGQTLFQAMKNHQLQLRKGD
jgi:hypothetical protein